MTQARTNDDELSYVRAGVEADIDGMVIHSLLRTHSRLSPLLDATLRAAQLTAAQFNTLLLLRHSGNGGLLMSQIGEGLIVTKSNVTGLIERLAKQGLVERCDHHDRRATRVRLTDAGHAMLDQASVDTDSQQAPSRPATEAGQAVHRWQRSCGLAARVTARFRLCARLALRVA